MQATLSAKWFVFNRMKLALVAAGVLASAVAGTAAVALTNDTADIAPARITAPVTTQFSTYRFTEINTLPVADTAPVNAARIHFLEMNELPVAASVAPIHFERIQFLAMNELPAAASVTMSPAQMRLLEINALPETLTAAPVHTVNQRLLEINRLPGDNAPMIPPTVMVGSPS